MLILNKWCWNEGKTSLRSYKKQIREGTNLDFNLMSSDVLNNRLIQVVKKGLQKIKKTNKVIVACLRPNACLINGACNMQQI